MSRIEIISLCILAYGAGLGSYWGWVILEHWHRQRKFYE